MTSVKTGVGESVRPLVSVCIPTYNRAQKLHRNIAKLLACDYSNIEVVISDNASDDDTAAVCESFVKSDSRVVYYRQPRNIGVVANFEFARSQARGEYFLWHADDDHMDPNFISSCVDLIEREKTVVLAYGMAAYHRGDNEIVAYARKIELPSKSAVLRVLKYLWKVTENSIFYGVYRRTAVRNCVVPGILAGDWAWVAQVVANGRIERVPGILLYRERGASVSSSPEGFQSLVRTLNLPNWQAKSPKIATAAGVGSFILRNPACFFARARWRSIPLAAAAFVMLLVKGNLPILTPWIRCLPGMHHLGRPHQEREDRH